MLLDAEQTRRGDAALFNATVVYCRDVNADLRILRVTSDEGRLDFAAGQYTALGLPEDPALAGHSSRPSLLKRSYSISCTMLSDTGELITASQCAYQEFYLTQVHPSEALRPTLSPRLFTLQPGDRIFMGPRAHGTYTLTPVRPTDDVIFLATGTGEAPHNAMVAELLARPRGGRIFCVTGARYRRDLGYLETHRELERRYPQYRYVALTTREPENLDPSHTGFIGKHRLQDFLLAGRLDALVGGTLDPERTQIFLCGNPQMIGAPKSAFGERHYPAPTGMVELLERRGFHADEPRRPGNIHFERYW